eukprot:scaffold230223_cov64-Attheya_sp.AAC.1
MDALDQQRTEACSRTEQRPTSLLNKFSDDMAQTVRVINLQSAHLSNDRQEDTIVVASPSIKKDTHIPTEEESVHPIRKTPISHRQNDTPHRQKDTPHRQNSSYRQKDTPPYKRNSPPDTLRVYIPQKQFSVTSTSISLVPPAQETLKILTARGEASHNGMYVMSICDVNQS